MLLLKAPEHILNSTVQLSGSKSISNRLLILKQVLGLNTRLENISTSEDTQHLQKALQQIINRTATSIDIGHAGTDMRFLTAYLSITEGNWTLTGSDRMKQRPIGELVNALRLLGADISYLEKENFPPLKINGKKLKGGKIEIDGSISSQFISALLLIAPKFENGLELTLKNEIVSWPYILMTLDLLSEFGMKVSTVLNTINVLTTQNKKQETRNKTFFVESDWSAASYWYSLIALSKNGTVILNGLSKSSSQGDSVLPEIYKELGVSSHFKDDQLILTKSKNITKHFIYNFTNCPDLAQTVAVTCLGLGIKAELTGLKTLKIKETDRILALKNELEKFGAEVSVTENSIGINDKRLRIQDTLVNINTYNDHRMAMSFAPLALVFGPLGINDPGVVAKSYPLFWEDLKSVGFSVNLQP
ncbi:MAG: 3-phosphoshikimate 1-carboxyvinyltransferase [Bacteroidia bacterium]|nr:3-phosphoshikimate 1-carboxyvinyltransferase [Bacteroidia bacterium]